MHTMYSTIIRFSLFTGVLVSLLGGGIPPASAQVLPPIITPSPGSTLTTTTVTFTGGHASHPGEEHWLSVGYGTRIWDNLIYHQSLGTGHTAQVSGLPSSGTLHVLYWTMTNAAGWGFRDHTYTMDVGSGGGGTGSQKSAVVVDANGKVLGLVLDTPSQQTSALIFQDPYVFPVFAAQNWVRGQFNNQFESTDCTGNPVIDTEDRFGVPFASQMATPATVVAQAINGEVLGKVYVADPNDTPHSVTVRSNAGDAGTLACRPENYQNMAVNTLQIMDLDALFTPPFHVTVK